MNPTAPDPAVPPAVPSAPAAPAKVELTDLTYDLVIAVPIEEQNRLMKKIASHVTALKESREENKTESKYVAIFHSEQCERKT